MAEKEQLANRSRGAEGAAEIGKIYVLAFSSISFLSDEMDKISHALTKSVLNKRLMVSRTCWLAPESQVKTIGMKKIGMKKHRNIQRSTTDIIIEAL